MSETKTKSDDPDKIGGPIEEPFKIEFNKKLEVLLESLQSTPGVFDENGKSPDLLSNELAKLDRTKKIFIMNHIDSFYKADKQLTELIDRVLSGKPQSAISKKYITNIYRLQKNILFTFIKENISNDCTDDIKKLLDISNNKLKTANDILEYYYNDNDTVKKSRPDASEKESLFEPVPVPELGPVSIPEPELGSKLQYSQHVQESLLPFDISTINSTEQTNQMSQSLDEDIRNINDSKGGTVNNMQTGGNSDALIHNINLIKDSYNILKSDIMIYVITLMSNKEKFNETISKISDVDILNIVKPFFINLSSYNLIVAEIRKYEDEGIFTNQITRDTKIYKTFDNLNQNNYIFGYTILHKIIIINSASESNILNFFQNEAIITQFYNLLMELIKNIKFIKFKLYDTLNNQYTLIKTEHTNYIDSLSQIYTYIKYRNDNVSSNINDRFKIKSFTAPGEKQNKYLLIKYNNYDTSNTNKKEEYYYTGPFNNIFDTTSDNTNKKIAEKCNIIINNLINNKTACIIGYGQSGSGKTSTLIQLNKTESSQVIRTKGIIIELLNSKEIHQTFSKISVQYKNIYINHHNGLQPTSISTLIDQKKYFVTNSIGDTSEFNYSAENGWINNDSNAQLGDSILNAFDRRQIEPSPNNPDSSRSHVIVIMTLTKLASETETSKLIICDFAGVENKFLCTDLEELIKFENQYNKSNKYKDKNITYDKYRCNLTTGITDYTENEQKEINNICTGKFKESSASKLTYIDEFLKGSTDKTIGNYIKYLEEQKTQTLKGINNYEKIELLLLTQDMLKTVEGKKVLNQESYNKFIDKYKDKIIFNSKSISDSVIDFLSNPNRDISIGKLYFSDKSSTSLFKITSNKWNNEKAKIKEEYEKIKKKTDDIKIIKVFELLNSYITDNRIGIKQYDEEQISSYEGAIKNYENEERRLDMLKHNCKLRVNEGYMINQTLRDFKDNIRNIIQSKLSLNLPLFFDQDIFPYCRNHNLKNEIFNKYYDIKPYDDNKNKFLLDILYKEGIEVSTLDFFIFTVINLTPTANNPPNPPYINLNDLIYHFKHKTNEEKNKSLKDFMENLQNYNFYKELAEFKDIRDSINIGKTLNDEGINNFITTIRNVIENNNELTLIGTLQTTDDYKHFINSDFVCSHSDTHHKDLQRKKHNKNTLRHILDAAKIETDIKKFNEEFIGL